jgi:hypothetical protein
MPASHITASIADLVDQRRAILVMTMTMRSKWAAFSRTSTAP